MIMDQRGDIWAATYENGVNRLNTSSGKITHYHFNKPGFGITDAPIALMEDKGGMIWVAGELMTDAGQMIVAVIDPVTNIMKKIAMGTEGVLRTVLTMAQSPITGKG